MQSVTGDGLDKRRERVNVTTGRWRSRHLFVVLVVSVLAVVLWAGWAALTARSDLLAVQADLESLREVAEPLDDPVTQQVIGAARERAARAADRLSAPGPALVAALPVLGRSLAAERDVARAAEAVLTAGDRLLPLVRDLEVSGGQVDLGSVDRLADELAESAQRSTGPLQQLNDAPLGATPGAVGDAVERARRELVPLGELLHRGAAGLRAVHGLLGGDGPRTVLVGVMNNAELRGAGGYVSSFAVVRADAGRVEVGRFQEVIDVQASPEQAVRVPAPKDFSRRYGVYLADTTLWKNVTMSPHAPASASVMCEVARLSPGIPCDGVVLLDVPALARIIDLKGPVTVAGAVVGGDELVRSLLVEAYADAENTASAQAERRAELRAAADAGLSELLGSSLAGADALRVLADASRGRHLAVFSARPEEQRRLYAAGLSGSSHPDGADLSLVSLNQMSAGKLDYYLQRAVEVDVVVGRRTAVVEQRVRLALDHPEGLPPYVLGVKEGQLDEIVDLGMARAARDITLTRDGAPAAFELVEDDVGAQHVVALLSLRNGEQAEYVLRYDVPLDDGRYALRLLPQPLAQDASLSLDVRVEDGLQLEGEDPSYDGPFDAARTVVVLAAAPSWWSRPVELP